MTLVVNSADIFYHRKLERNYSKDTSKGREKVHNRLHYSVSSIEEEGSPGQGMLLSFAHHSGMHYNIYTTPTKELHSARSLRKALQDCLPGCKKSDLHGEVHRVRSLMFAIQRYNRFITGGFLYTTPKSLLSCFASLTPEMRKRCTKVNLVCGPGYFIALQD